jgi:aspartyl-tRNA(Asn)/glutamyl-tRNA(Gln) amidotransferase subunit A
MQSEPLTSLTCSEASKLIHSREIKCTELTEALLEAAEVWNPLLKCYGLVTSDRAMDHAAALDELLGAGIDLSPIHGIPVAVKDCIDTAGIPTTMGSQIEKDRVPSEDAWLVKSLYRSGAVVLGKANLYEWCYGGPSTLWGEVFNPWGLNYTSGASSNGSAAAVAAGIAMGAVGSDNGGSIRLPSGLCGVFGMKPTFGRISHSGVFPPGSSLDHVGPITRDVEGSAMMLQAMAGHDRNDPNTWSAPPPDDYCSYVGRSIKGLRVGIPRHQEGEVLEQDIELAIQEAVAILRNAGCQIVEIELPSLLDARTMMWAISGAEAAEAHKSNLRTKGELYHPNVRKLLAIGEFVPATDYVHSFRVRQVLMNKLAELFDSIEAIVMPCLPLGPWPSGQNQFHLGGIVEDDMNVLSRYCPLFNLTGHPAASALAGFNSSGLPLALQLVAPMYKESTIIRIAYVLEQANQHVKRRPQLPMLPKAN